MKRFFLIVLCAMLLSFSCAHGEEPGGDIPLSGTIQDTQPGSDLPEGESGGFSAAVVPSGELLWRITGKEVVCTDAASRQDVARLPISDLPVPEDNNQLPAAKGFIPEWAFLLAGNGNGIRLCVSGAGDNGVLRVLLFDLERSGSRIDVSAVSDETELLRSFFDGSSIWLGLDMACFSSGTMIIALDNNSIYHLFRWDISDHNLEEIGTEQLFSFMAAVPYDSGALVAAFSLVGDTELDLRVMDLSSGESNLLDTVRLESDVLTLFNFAWNASEQQLFFTAGNTVYRYTLGSGSPPVPVAVTDKTPADNRLGTVAGGNYVLCADDGSLVWCDPHAELKASRIRVSDASGDEYLPDIAFSFNGSQAAFHVTVSSCNDDSVILDQLLSQSGDYDIYVISTDSSVYSAMKNRGYFREVDGSGTIASAVAGMPESVRSTVSVGGRLAGLPICTQNSTLLLNVDAIRELVGCSREEIPTDWPGMLRLLNQMAEDGILTGNPEYTVYESGSTSSSLKEGLFALILNDCLLWQKQTGASPDDIPAVLLPVLREFNAISWDQFGLPEEETFTTDWKLINNAQVPLLSVIQAEIAVMDLDGMEYWPLSLTGECPRLIPETVSVMLINPWSIQASGALAFMEYTWDNLDVLAKMSLDPVMDGPVENTAYAEDIAYLEQLVSSYQKQIDAAGTDEEAEALRQEMSDAEEFLSDYREHAGLLVSESSIAEYRALASQFVPAVPEFWSADEEDAAVLQFLDGMMPAEQFVTQFVSALKMSLLEGE